MYYVEFLRARKILYWTAAWLAFFLSIGLLARIQAGPPHAESMGAVPLEAFAGAGALVASIVATILACGLSFENSGHLALAWTKPASRAQLAVVMSVVDLCAIAVAFALGIAFGLGVLALAGHSVSLQTDASTTDFVVRSLIAPLAWYGLTRAATASVRAKSGAIAASLWIVGGVVVGLDQSHILGGVFGMIVSALDKINPMYYFQLSFDDQGHNTTLVKSMVAGVAGLVGIAAVGYAAALAQWRRLEA